jgi:hypothetical protein
VSAHIQCMVCMYVCMCVRMYVYVHVCICMLYMLHAPRRAAARGASGSALLTAPTPPQRTLPGRTRTQAVRARRLDAGVARACALQCPTIPASRACRQQHVIIDHPEQTLKIAFWAGLPPRTTAYDGEGGVLCGLYCRQDLQGQGRLLELCVRALRARVEEPYDLLFPLPARPLLAMRTAAAGAAERGGAAAPCNT